MTKADDSWVRHTSSQNKQTNGPKKKKKKKVTSFAHLNTRANSNQAHHANYDEISTHSITSLWSKSFTCAFFFPLFLSWQPIMICRLLLFINQQFNIVSNSKFLPSSNTRSPYIHKLSVAREIIKSPSNLHISILLFFYVPCPYRAWTIIAIHNFLSFLAFINVCLSYYPSQSLICHPLLGKLLASILSSMSCEC